MVEITVQMRGDQTETNLSVSGCFFNLESSCRNLLVRLQILIGVIIKAVQQQPEILPNLFLSLTFDLWVSSQLCEPFINKTMIQSLIKSSLFDYKVI